MSSTSRIQHWLLSGRYVPYLLAVQDDYEETNIVHHTTGRRRTDVQSLWMASRTRCSCPGRESTTASSLRAAEMGTRPDCREGRRTCLHSDISAFRGIFRDSTQVGRKPETWRAWKTFTGIRPSLGRDFQFRTWKTESDVEKEEWESTEEDCCFETMMIYKVLGCIRDVSIRVLFSRIRPMRVQLVLYKCGNVILGLYLMDWIKMADSLWILALVNRRINW